MKIKFIFFLAFIFTLTKAAETSCDTPLDCYTKALKSITECENRLKPLNDRILTLETSLDALTSKYESLSKSLPQMVKSLQNLENKCFLNLLSVLQPAILLPNEDFYVIIWNQERLRVNDFCFNQSADKSKIIIKKRGIYRIDMSLVKENGDFPLYPFLAVNKQAIAYVYSQSGGYVSSNLHYEGKFNEGDSLEIGFQNGGRQFYLDGTANTFYGHNRLFIEEM